MIEHGLHEAEEEHWRKHRSSGLVGGVKRWPPIILEKRGYRILARNVRTARGEIDLIARLDSCCGAAWCLSR